MLDEANNPPSDSTYKFEHQQYSSLALPDSWEHNQKAQGVPLADMAKQGSKSSFVVDIEAVTTPQPPHTQDACQTCGLKTAHVCNSHGEICTFSGDGSQNRQVMVQPNVPCSVAQPEGATSNGPISVSMDGVQATEEPDLLLPKIHDVAEPIPKDSKVVSLDLFGIGAQFHGVTADRQAGQYTTLRILHANDAHHGTASSLSIPSSVMAQASTGDVEARQHPMQDADGQTTTVSKGFRNEDLFGIGAQFESGPRS